MIVTNELTIARKAITYLLDATSTWDSTTNHKLVVPTGKRWKVLVITVKNDVNATVSTYWLDSSDVVIAQLGNQAANTARTTWPDTGTSDFLQGPENLIMDAGEQIEIACGVAQGAGAYIYVHALEVDI